MDLISTMSPWSLIPSMVPISPYSVLITGTSTWLSQPALIPAICQRRCTIEPLCIFIAFFWSGGSRLSPR